ncbi:hypothetical protein ES703_96108 [subsurface metagenome]
MNVESFSYSILATVLGMLVVFLFLSFLSFLMSALKAIFKAKKQQAVVAVKEEKKASEPDWLLAAVSAYMALEEEEACPFSAGARQAKAADQNNPWLTGGKFLKRGIGER